MHPSQALRRTLLLLASAISVATPAITAVDCKGDEQHIAVVGMSKSEDSSGAVGIYSRHGELHGRPVWRKVATRACKGSNCAAPVYIFYFPSVWAIGHDLGFPPFLFARASKAKTPVTRGASWTQFKQAPGLLGIVGGGSEKLTNKLRIWCVKPTRAPTPRPTLQQMQEHMQGSIIGAPTPNPRGPVETMAPHLENNGVSEEAVSAAKPMTDSQLDKLVRDLRRTPSPTPMPTPAPAPWCNSVRIDVAPGACMKCAHVTGFYERDDVRVSGRAVYSKELLDGSSIYIFFTPAAPATHSPPHWSVADRIGVPPYRMVARSLSREPFESLAKWQALAETIDGTLTSKTLPTFKIHCASGPLAVVQSDLHKEKAQLEAIEAAAQPKSLQEQSKSAALYRSHVCPYIWLRCSGPSLPCARWDFSTVQWHRVASRYLGTYALTQKHFQRRGVYKRSGGGGFLYYREHGSNWVVSHVLGAAPFIFTAKGDARTPDELRKMQWFAYNDDAQTFAKDQGLQAVCREKPIATPAPTPKRTTAAPHKAGSESVQLFPSSVACERVLIAGGQSLLQHHVQGVYVQRVEQKNERPTFVHWHHGKPYFLYWRKEDVSWVVSRVLDSTPFLLMAPSRAASPTAVARSWEWWDDPNSKYFADPSIAVKCTNRREVQHTAVRKEGHVAMPELIPVEPAPVDPKTTTVAPMMHRAGPPAVSSTVRCASLHLWGLETDSQAGAAACEGIYKLHGYFAKRPVFQLQQRSTACGHPGATFLFFHPEDRMWVVGTVRKAPWKLHTDGKVAHNMFLRFSSDSTRRDPTNMETGWTVYSSGDAPPQWSKNLKFECHDGEDSRHHAESAPELHARSQDASRIDRNDKHSAIQLLPQASAKTALGAGWHKHLRRKVKKRRQTEAPATVRHDMKSEESALSALESGIQPRKDAEADFSKAEIAEARKVSTSLLVKAVGMVDLNAAAEGSTHALGTTEAPTLKAGASKGLAKAFGAIESSKSRNNVEKPNIDPLLLQACVCIIVLAAAVLSVRKAKRWSDAHERYSQGYNPVPSSRSSTSGEFLPSIVSVSMQAGTEKWTDEQMNNFLGTEHGMGQSGIPPRAPGSTSPPPLNEALSSHSGVRRRSGDRHVKLELDDDNDEDMY